MQIQLYLYSLLFNNPNVSYSGLLSPVQMLFIRLIESNFQDSFGRTINFELVKGRVAIGHWVSYQIVC